LLYSAINFPSEQISPEYYIEKLNEYLEQPNEQQIKIANSKIFQYINRDSLKEFLKLNKRNKIMQLNDLVEKMFNECKYQEIIDNLEEFADTHRLVSIFVIKTKNQNVFDLTI
jgi:hypothetical protein